MVQHEEPSSEEYQRTNKRQRITNAVEEPKVSQNPKPAEDKGKGVLRIVPDAAKDHVQTGETQPAGSHSLNIAGPLDAGLNVSTDFGEQKKTIIMDDVKKPKATTIVTLKEKGATGATQNTTTVQTIIPVPTTSLVDHPQVSHYDDALLKRIETLSTYVNKEANVYALGKILPIATWGNYQPFSDHRTELCNPMTNEPLILWTIGHVASSWFLRQGEPEKQASITVIPLSEPLAMQTAKLVAGLASPPLKVEDSMKAVRAIKWQSGKDSDTSYLFDKVYDAREVLTNKSDMEQYSAADLKKDDLVLLETKVTRYRMKDDNNKWTIQRVQMEMLAISLLFSAPSTAVSGRNDTQVIVGLRI